MRVVLPLQDGDAFALGLPGYRSVLYRFARSGEAVSIEVEMEPRRVAAEWR
jgi:hypothetical protein